MRLVFLCLFVCAQILLQAHSIVFIHIGSKLPEHVYISIDQARLFNEECPIFLVANEEALQNTESRLQESNISCITCESLVPSVRHAEFHNNPSHDWGYESLWVYSTERFFYLEELMRQYALSDVFHIESDVMLYVDVSTLLPIFRKHYQGMIGAIFEHDNRCVPSFVYIADLKPITALIDCFPQVIDMFHSDMDSLAYFKNKHYKKLIDYLPVIVPEYSKDHPRTDPSDALRDPLRYSNHVEDFGVLFDGAAFGVYLAGWDARFWNSGPCISHHAMFNPSLFTIDWEVDAQERKAPFATYKGRRLPIANLHITNKGLIKNFYSAKEDTRQFYSLGDRWGTGMFSMLSDVLAMLCTYEQGTIRGVEVKFGQGGLYWEKDRGPNWWNYYCEPLCVGVKKNVVDAHYGSVQSMGHYSFKSREDAYLLIQKYFKFLPHIVQKVDDFVEKYFKDQYVIGMHYRGTDAPGSSPSYETYAQEVSKIVGRLNISNYKIFIATDEQPFLDYMMERFPEHVCFQHGALRSSQGGTPLHFVESYSKYKQGEEAIVDCLLLSKGQQLLLAYSNLSQWSALFNPYAPVIDMTGGLPSLFK